MSSSCNRLSNIACVVSCDPPDPNEPASGTSAGRRTDRQLRMTLTLSLLPATLDRRRRIAPPERARAMTNYCSCFLLHAVTTSPEPTGTAIPGNHCCIKRVYARTSLNIVIRRMARRAGKGGRMETDQPSYRILSLNRSTLEDEKSEGR